MTAHSKWYDIEVDGHQVGHMSNGVWSYRKKRNIGFALVRRGLSAGDRVEVRKDDQSVMGTLCALPFI